MLCFSRDGSGRHDVLFFFFGEGVVFLCFAEEGVVFLFLLFWVFFFFFFFFKVQIQRNREKRFNHGSQNRAVEPRFKRFPAFLA